MKNLFHFASGHSPYREYLFREISDSPRERQNAAQSELKEVEKTVETEERFNQAVEHAKRLFQKIQEKNPDADREKIVGYVLQTAYDNYKEKFGVVLSKEQIRYIQDQIFPPQKAEQSVQDTIAGDTIKNGASEQKTESQEVQDTSIEAQIKALQREKNLHDPFDNLDYLQALTEMQPKTPADILAVTREVLRAQMIGQPLGGTIRLSNGADKIKPEDLENKVRVVYDGHTFEYSKEELR